MKKLEIRNGNFEAGVPPSNSPRKRGEEATRSGAKGGGGGNGKLGHAPVMLREVLQAMQPKDGEIYVDGTFGAGGYSRALLEAAQCKVFAIDRDPSAGSIAEQLRQEFNGRFVFIAGNFGDMVELLAAHGVTAVHGIVLDIGVSSMQIDEAERGFSFRADGPLDMRMSAKGMSAEDVVNTLEEETLANVIYQFGEEKDSRRIAKAIVRARQQKKIIRTGELADIVRGAVRHSGQKIDPATRTFQALRIYVNDELGELERALHAAESLLVPGGRLVVVAFHSLEDRMVKQFLLSRCGDTRGVSRHLPQVLNPRQSPDGGRKENGRTLPPFFLHQRGALFADESEIEKNPRARSARLRCAVRTEAHV